MDAERFIEDVLGDEPELAKELRIEEREIEAGGRAGERGALSASRRKDLRAGRRRGKRDRPARLSLQVSLPVMPFAVRAPVVLRVAVRLRVAVLV